MLFGNWKSGIAEPLYIAVYFLVGDLILSVYQILSLKFVLRNRLSLQQSANEKLLLEEDRTLEGLKRARVYSWLPEVASDSSEASFMLLNTRIAQDS